MYQVQNFFGRIFVVIIMMYICLIKNSIKMKKLLVLILVLLTTISFGQRKEKIKGNKEVLIKKFTIPLFENIEVGEKFKVGLVKSTDTTRIEIETDDNLFDVIHFAVENGTLKFSTSKEIVKKKRLKITVFIPDNLASIRVIEKGKIYNEDALSFENLKIEAEKRGKLELNTDVKNDLQIIATDKTDIKIEGTSKSLDIKLQENAKLNGELSAKSLIVQLDDHSNMSIKGKVNEAKITTNSKTEFKAKDFEISNAVLRANDKSDVYINVNDNLSLRAIGETEVYIYNNPKINLKAFKDNAVLYKK